MNINEVINTKINQGEHKEIPLTKKLIGISNFIKKNCSDILKIYSQTNCYLYRGCNYGSMIVMGNSSIDRKPKDCSFLLQKVIDTKLKEGGFKALRSNSIFCTSNNFRARSYGSLYMIFPLNGFNYTYSENIWDFYMNGPKFNTIKNYLGKEFIDKYKFKYTNIKKALVDDNYSPEIYINGKYIAINVDNTYDYVENIKPIMDKLGINI